MQVLKIRTKGHIVARRDRNHEVLFSVDRRHFLGYAGAGMLAAVLPACCNGDIQSTPYQQTITLGRQMIQQAVSNPSSLVAAISIAMVKGSTVVWQQAFGLASVPGQIKATPQTRFNIGPVSKLFPVLAATILFDRGLITLDTPIVKYLPTFTMLSPEYAQITTRHLLSHASGLPGTNGRNLFTFEPVAGYAADTQAELANSHLKHLPGELAVYCNDGFTMSRADRARHDGPELRGLRQVGDPRAAEDDQLRLEQTIRGSDGSLWTKRRTRFDIIVSLQPIRIGPVFSVCLLNGELHRKYMLSHVAINKRGRGSEEKNAPRGFDSAAGECVGCSLHRAI